MALVNLCCVIVMYCLALAGCEGSRTDKAAAAILFAHNLFLLLFGPYL